MSNFIKDVDLNLVKYLLENFKYEEPKTFNENICRQEIINKTSSNESCAFAIQLACQGYSSSMEIPLINIENKQYKLTDKYPDLKLVKKPKISTDISLNRIVRVYKNEIREFIKNTGISTQFEKKFNKVNKFKDVMFPNAEFLDLNDDEALALCSAYDELDKELILQGKKHGFAQNMLNILKVKKRNEKVIEAMIGKINIVEENV
jgi:hypothetical protein